MFAVVTWLKKHTQKFDFQDGLQRFPEVFRYRRHL